jgi:uncharacterized protein YukE
MDPAAVRQFAQQLNQKAGEIQSIMQQLTSSLQGTPWLGADRQQFESDWNGQHCAALRQVIQGLEDAATRAVANAQQQEQASQA